MRPGSAYRTEVENAKEVIGEAVSEGGQSVRAGPTPAMIWPSTGEPEGSGVRRGARRARWTAKSAGRGHRVWHLGQMMCSGRTLALRGIGSQPRRPQTKQRMGYPFGWRAGAATGAPSALTARPQALQTRTRAVPLAGSALSGNGPDC